MKDKYTMKTKPGEVYTRRNLHAYIPQSTLERVMEKTGCTRKRAEVDILRASIIQETDHALYLEEADGEWLILQDLACQVEDPLEPAVFLLPNGAMLS